MPHFRYLRIGLSSLAVAGGLCLALTASASATGYTPHTGATFNKPTGTQAEQYAIMDQLMASVDAAPKGSAIRMAMYSISIQDFSDKLIAAHQRGVNVQLLMDDHSLGDQWLSLVNELGTDTQAKSFAVTCHHSCLAESDISYMHAKFYMFSTTGSAKKVVTVSSANPTNSQAKTGWNNAYTMVGDST